MRHGHGLERSVPDLHHAGTGLNASAANPDGKSLLLLWSPGVRGCCGRTPGVRNGTVQLQLYSRLSAHRNVYIEGVSLRGADCSAEWQPGGQDLGLDLTPVHRSKHRQIWPMETGRALRKRKGTHHSLNENELCKHQSCTPGGVAGFKRAKGAGPVGAEDEDDLEVLEPSWSSCSERVAHRLRTVGPETAR